MKKLNEVDRYFKIYCKLYLLGIKNKSLRIEDFNFMKFRLNNKDYRSILINMDDRLNAYVKGKRSFNNSIVFLPLLP